MAYLMDFGLASLHNNVSQLLKISQSLSVSLSLCVHTHTHTHTHTRIRLPMQEIRKMQIQSLSWKDPLEKEMGTHSSILA